MNAPKASLVMIDIDFGSRADGAKEAAALLALKYLDGRPEVPLSVILELKPYQGWHNPYSKINRVGDRLKLKFGEVFQEGYMADAREKYWCFNGKNLKFLEGGKEVNKWMLRHRAGQIGRHRQSVLEEDFFWFTRNLPFVEGGPPAAWPKLVPRLESLGADALALFVFQDARRALKDKAHPDRFDKVLAFAKENCSPSQNATLTKPNKKALRGVVAYFEAWHNYDALGSAAQCERLLNQVRHPDIADLAMSNIWLKREVHSLTSLILRRRAQFRYTEVAADLELDHKKKDRSIVEIEQFWDEALEENARAQQVAAWVEDRSALGDLAANRAIMLAARFRKAPRPPVPLEKEVILDRYAEALGWLALANQLKPFADSEQDLWGPVNLLTIARYIRSEDTVGVTFGAVVKAGKNIKSDDDLWVEIASKDKPRSLFFSALRMATPQLKHAYVPGNDLTPQGWRQLLNLLNELALVADADKLDLVNNTEFDQLRQYQSVWDFLPEGNQDQLKNLLGHLNENYKYFRFPERIKDRRFVRVASASAASSKHPK